MLPAGDLDARLVPWELVRRLALEAGQHPPIDEPISGAQWRELLRAVPGREVAPSEEASCGSAGDPSHRFRVGARLLAGYQDRGLRQAGEAGLAWGAGWNATAEAGAQMAGSRWWGALTTRLHVQPGWGAGPPILPLEAEGTLWWPGWDPATGPAQERRAMLQSDELRLDVVRAVVGLTLGRWALSAGWEPRRNGPGLGGALLLDRGGRPFPALTARRTAPLRWRGIMRPLGPQQLLFRAGLLSRRSVADERAPDGFRQDRPWFLQWLVRWRVTDWFRFGCTQTAMAVPREGTLWPDLLQINFPLAGATWREMESGPYTDRLFAVQMEFRWRRAPWSWLPSSAGRAWWEYAGTDFLPRGPGGLIPEISAPASVAGVELFGPRWDLAVEYAETLHPLVLWYSNGAFPAGYTHEAGLLGHPLGGAGEQVSAVVRWRGLGGQENWFGELGGVRAGWGDQGHTPVRAREWTVSLKVGPLRDGLPGPWKAGAAWHRTTSPDGGGGRRSWWSTSVERSF